MKADNIIIVGGGLIGVTTAYELVRRGYPVTLLEAREGLALETSYANGSLQSASMPEPWNGPGVMGHLASSVFDPGAPMKLRLHALPSLFFWGLKFLRNSSSRQYWLASEANFRLGEYSVRLTREVRDDLGLEYDSMDTGVLYIFRDRRAMGAAQKFKERMRPLGLRYNLLSTDQAIEREPCLEQIRQHMVGAFYYSADGCGDAHKFTRALAAHVQRLGGEIRTGVTVKRLLQQSGRVTGVVTDAADMAASKVIVATGIRAPELTRPVGLHPAIKPVKGYSVTFDAGGLRDRLKIPLVDDTLHVVIVPVGNRLRIAGTAEFAGFDRELTRERVDNLYQVLEATLPDTMQRIDRDSASAWTGLRPMSADGRAYIGRTSVPGLYLNAGHGQLGWTLAMGSARALVDQMEDKATEVPLEPFDARR